MGGEMTGPDLTDQQLKYLRSLVRMSLRKRRKTIDRFAPKADQDPREAADTLAAFKADLAFRERVYIALGGHLEEGN